MKNKFNRSKNLNKLTKAVDIIKKSSYIVAFTGAGISVASGIPDFRSPGGLWERFDPETYASFWAFKETPENFWKMHKELSAIVIPAIPNAAHHTLAQLEHEFGKLKSVITQNIDYLHQKAGNTLVYELHGNGSTASCLNCKKNYSYEFVQEQLDRDVKAPKCSCSGLVKPDVVLFGEPLPYTTQLEAQAEITKCDLLIIIGSSLQVFPAADMPAYAKRKSKPAKVIIINKESTPFDKSADLVLNGEAVDILSNLVHILEQQN